MKLTSLTVRLKFHLMTQQGHPFPSPLMCLLARGLMSEREQLQPSLLSSLELETITSTACHWPRAILVQQRRGLEEGRVTVGHPGGWLLQLS